MILTAVIMEQTTIRAKVTEGGRIVIPAKFRKALGIEVGKTVSMTLKEGSLSISTKEAAFRKIEKMMRNKIKPGHSVVDEFLRERRQDAAHE